jgi:tetratricopeptide (TPR) repeat protein
VRRTLGVAILLLLAACKTPLRPAPPASLPTSVEGLAAAIATDSQRSEHEPDPTLREALALDADRAATACLERAPQAAPCLYYHAVALGLAARAHPTRAGELLRSMLEALAAAEMADPEYDDAGPLRVRALVLIRAPGWPLGPGDPESGVSAARRAVELRPQYPPNLLALAEALGKTGDRSGAQENYRRARDLAQALPPAPDRNDWLAQADQALRRR